MSSKPVLSFQVNEETQLRLLEERHVRDYFALIQCNKKYLYAWIDVEAYEGSVETLRSYVKQRLLQFANGEGYHLGIWYQDSLIGILDYRPNWKNRTVELGYWLDFSLQGKGIVTQSCRTMMRHTFEEHHMQKVVIFCAIDNPRSELSTTTHIQPFIQKLINKLPRILRAICALFLRKSRKYMNSVKRGS